MKQFIIIFVVISLLGLGVAYFLTNGFGSNIEVTQQKELPQKTTPDEQVDEDIVEGEELDTADEVKEDETVVGTSVEGRDIAIYHYGKGDTEIMFVGGIHGGYSWNTSLVAYELMDYLDDNPEVIPDNVMVTVIPTLNPDGLYAVTGEEGRFKASDVSSSEKTIVDGRFNANNVDLNRNFECDWQSSGTWQNKTVSGGTGAFSEPESKAMELYVNKHKPEAVVAWYSAAGGVFASSCHNGVSSDTSKLTQLYAKASGYKAYEEFNFYEITGDMMNWLAKNNIPAISVLLTNHKDTEWNRNKAGIVALLENYKE